MYDILDCAWRELMRRRSRMIVNVLGYFLAVVVMLILVSWLQFSRRASDEILQTTGTHFIVFSPSTFCCPLKAAEHKNQGTETFVAAGVTTQLFSSGMVDRIRALPGVKDASPYLSFRLKDPKDGHLFTIGGFDPGQPVSVGSTTCAPTDLTAGRFLSTSDRGVAMLEKAYADSRGLENGAKLTISGKKFTVVGIVAPATRPAKADIYLHIDDAEAIINVKRKTPFSRKDSVNIVLVEIKSSRLQDQAIRDVKNLDKKFTVSGFACYRPAATVMGINEKAIMFILVLVAFGTLVFSVKSQLSSVIERQHDIGILKAIGWSDRSVVSQILAESVMQALLGAAFGCIIAKYIVFLAPLREWSGIQSNLDVVLAPPILVAAVVLAVAGGVLAGVFPAWSAARKNPAEALRFK